MSAISELNPLIAATGQDRDASRLMEHHWLTTCLGYVSGLTMIGQKWTLSRAKRGGHQRDRDSFLIATLISDDDVETFNGDDNDHCVGHGMVLDKSRTAAIQASITSRLMWPGRRPLKCVQS